MSGDIGVSESCPSCKAHFVYCSLIEETKSRLKLECEKCLEQNSLHNTEEQRKFLSSKYGHPSQVVQLTKIDQLHEGDAIGFKRKKAGIGYEHHAIVVAVNKDKGTVDVVEFESISKMNGIRPPIARNTMDFKGIGSKNAWLRQYMPLDCYPRKKVVNEAMSSIGSSTLPKYDVTSFNCQHLTSLCKTGETISEGADELNKGMKVLSAGGVGMGIAVAATVGLAKVGVITVASIAAKAVAVATVGATVIVAVPIVAYGIYKLWCWLSK